MFSQTPPTVMYIDLNSCFASVEQQANPLLRGKPVVVAAYATDRGCILAASREAKALGIKTGMRVGEGKSIYPRLIVLPSDPDKYRFVNHALTKLLSSYTDTLSVESIDEIVMDLKDTPALERCLSSLRGPAKRGEAISLRDCRASLALTEQGMKTLAQEIKTRIKQEIGEWLTVSVGIAPNRYLAKTASNLHKPDGLDAITKENIEEVLGTLQLEDLTGIKKGNADRLRSAGIFTPLAMYGAPPKDLQRAFRSIVGYEWWQRFHGYRSSKNEHFGMGHADEQKTIGHSYALYKPFPPSDPKLHQILSQLVVKVGRRLRKHGVQTRGVHISCLFADYSSWNHGEKLGDALFADEDLYVQALRILKQAPDKPVRILAVTSYALADTHFGQQSLFDENSKKQELTHALDAIADRFGEFTVFPGRMLGMEEKVLDRIAFGKVGELQYP